MQHLQPNTTLQGGKYRIERVLGQGGFGITYLAVQTSLNRFVAIKELFIGGSGQAINDRRGSVVVVTNSANQASFNQQKAKFKKEALRLANLNHPNLVKVHDFFEENGTAYYVMDYIEGESLRTKLNREGVLSEGLVLKYLQQLLPALETAHKQNIWHLDIKPENIMVDRYGHVYLIDFGASKHIEQNSTLTTSLALAYTKGYCPPELADLTYESDLVQALKEIGSWTDIYALGATMYNLLTDSIPPSSNRLYKMGRNAFSFSNNISLSTQDLIVWMMKPDREDRPQSIDAIIRAVETRKEEPKQAPKHNPTSQKTTAYDDEATIFEEGISIDLLNKKALEGESLAQYMLGIRYERGGDIDHAIKWFAYSAQNGNVKAMDQIIEYANRQIRNLHLEEVSKNQQDSLFVKANNGNANAQYFIGLRYMHGIGEKKSKNEAIKWFTMSAKQGEMRAMEKLVELLTNCGGLFYAGEYLSKRN